MAAETVLAAKRKSPGLTHLDAGDRPAMVDVGDKAITRRSATAEAHVRLPRAIAAALRATGHRTRKGPVFDTAVIAGVLGAKRTSDLIPFCHPVPLNNCAIEVEAVPGGIRIRCTASVEHRTGVEMEALTGATVAALTVYDMCKALSHDIEITTVRLLAKSGGKQDYNRQIGAQTGRGTRPTRPSPRGSTPRPKRP
jgi:cyclic pyranopterin phosphate synthase